MTTDTSPDQPAYRRPGLLALLTLLAALPLLSVTATGAEAPPPAPEATDGTATAALAELVTSGTVPAGLSDSLGYRPGEKDGYATDPHGTCSSPIALPASFEAACRTHDLGYDLLRVADARGETISPALREAVDRQFFARIFDSCGSLECRAKAAAATAVVTGNTIRQPGAPVVEDWPWSEPAGA